MGPKWKNIGLILKRSNCIDRLGFVMESETYEQRRHKVDHISKYGAIPNHKHHVSIIFQEVIPRDKSFATHRANFYSNYVSNQMVMNFTKLKEVFVHNMSMTKKIL